MKWAIALLWVGVTGAIWWRWQGKTIMAWLRRTGWTVIADFFAVSYAVDASLRPDPDLPFKLVFLSVMWCFVFAAVGQPLDQDLLGDSEEGPRPPPPPESEAVQGIGFNARLRTGWSRGAEGQESYTEFACEAFSGMARVVIASPTWAHRGRTHPTMAPLDVGAWPYAVTTNDAAFAVRILDFETRRLIEEVDALHEGALLVDLRPGALLIRAAGVKSREATLEFARKASAVAARLRGAIREELSIDAGVGTCRVCGVALAGVTVSCGKCSTPHHRECWEYNGGCSVYACGGTSKAD